MGRPWAPDALAALLTGTVGVLAWPLWQTTLALLPPQMPPWLAPLALLAGFRFALAPVRAAFSWLLASAAASRQRHRPTDA